MLRFCQWRQKQKVSNTSNSCWYMLIYTFGYIKHMCWLYQSDAKWSGKWKMWKRLSIWDSTPAICHGGAAVKPSSHVKLPENFWNTEPNTFFIHFHSFSACSASSAFARRMNWGTCQTCHQLVFASWCHHCLQLGEFIIIHHNAFLQRLCERSKTLSIGLYNSQILSWLHSSCVLSPQLSVPNSKMWHVTEAHPRQSQKIDPRWKAEWSGWNKSPKLNHVKP